MQSLYSIVNNGINRDQLQDIYVTSDVRHLGNFFDSNLVNNVDSFHKCSQFIGQFINLRSKFGHLQPDIQGNFMKSHCCSLKKSFLWQYNSDGFKKICIQWNKSVRKYFELPNIGGF